MPEILIPLADGSEEIEAVTLIDVLRRAGFKPCVASVMPYTRITASRGVVIEADTLLDNSTLGRPWDLIALPGGMPGAQHLAEHPGLRQLLASTSASLAAICAAPAVVLARQGLLKGLRCTAYPAFWPELRALGLAVEEQPLVIDGRVITSQGPATAMLFALSLVEYLSDASTAQATAQALLIPYNPHHRHYRNNEGTAQ
jgi:protein deglycase